MKLTIISQMRNASVTDGIVWHSAQTYNVPLEELLDWVKKSRDRITGDLSGEHIVILSRNLAGIIMERLTIKCEDRADNSRLAAALLNAGARQERLVIAE